MSTTYPLSKTATVESDLSSHRFFFDQAYSTRCEFGLYRLQIQPENDCLPHDSHATISIKLHL